jgi:hypothetical protein
MGRSLGASRWTLIERWRSPWVLFGACLMLFINFYLLNDVIRRTIVLPKFLQRIDGQARLFDTYDP